MSLLRAGKPSRIVSKRLQSSLLPIISLSDIRLGSMLVFDLVQALGVEAPGGFDFLDQMWVGVAAGDAAT